MQRFCCHEVASGRCVLDRDSSPILAEKGECDTPILLLPPKQDRGASLVGIIIIQFQIEQQLSVKHPNCSQKRVAKATRYPVVGPYKHFEEDELERKASFGTH